MLACFEEFLRDDFGGEKRRDITTNAAHIDWPLRRLEADVDRIDRYQNKVSVTLANKLARIAWSVLRHKTAFDAPRGEVVVGVYGTQ